jgi:hypothetical protein
MKKPILCTLPEGTLAQRRFEIHALFETRTRLTHQADGLELEWPFSEQTARALLDFILFERACCNAFAYELSTAPPHDRLLLRLRAPAEQVEALRELYR